MSRMILTNSNEYFQKLNNINNDYPILKWQAERENN